MKHSDLEKLATNINRKPGDAIEGERVIAHARKIEKKDRKVKGTSSHSMGEVKLESNCLCVLDKAFRVTRPATKPEPKK